ncbi:hypothetical protein EIL87_24970 [Saccharopolyspora rhizosphaerae]|uniref:Uncharacterized protein n=1 Tax=Saccharopolyspora rhizosphaerae TaxID=2492662 RepID=A0A426JIF6_9PSEU|nr:hypothetical protein [Saccharopolyspora rhizosphaerae]RRO12923.1 hypothetical protein EIL87_24970 [Saccharopolyspora rhizosphaerae]
MVTWLLLIGLVVGGGLGFLVGYLVFRPKQRSGNGQPPQFAQTPHFGQAPQWQQAPPQQQWQQVPQQQFPPQQGFGPPPRPPQ